jgi:hypothetical protein
VSNITSNLPAPDQTPSSAQCCDVQLQLQLQDVAFYQHSSSSNMAQRLTGREVLHAGQTLNVPSGTQDTGHTHTQLELPSSGPNDTHPRKPQVKTHSDAPLAGDPAAVGGGSFAGREGQSVGFWIHHAEACEDSEAVSRTAAAAAGTRTGGSSSEL